MLNWNGIYSNVSSFANNVKSWWYGGEGQQPALSDNNEEETPEFQSPSWSYYGKQAAKGAVIFGAGVCAYLGFSALLNKDNRDNRKDKQNLAEEITPLSKKNGMVPKPLPTFSSSFSPTGRTLLAIEEETPEFYQGGQEFRVNSYTTSEQGRDNFSPSAITFSDGTFAIIWNSDGQDGDSYGVFCKVFDGTGKNLTSDVQVNSYTNLAQGYNGLSGCALPEGKFAVVWSSIGQDGWSTGVFSRILKREGESIIPITSEFPINTFTKWEQDYPSVTSLPEGKFAVVWQSYGQLASDIEIYGRILNVTGDALTSELLINSYTTSYQDNPFVIGLRDGKFAVVWCSVKGGNQNVFGKVFDSFGQNITLEFPINSYTMGEQGWYSLSGSALRGDDSGKFAVFWDSYDGSNHGVSGRILGDEGLPSTDEFPVNSYTIGEQGNSGISAATLFNKELVVVWSSDNQDGSGKGIYGQMLNITGDKINSEFPININTTSDQTQPCVTALGDGGFLVAWISKHQDGTRDIFARIFEPVVSYIINNKLIILEGENLQVTSDFIKAAKPSNTSNQDITFIVGNVLHGQFENTDNPNIAINFFNQQDIIDNKIKFIHDGGELAPSFETKLIVNGKNITDYQHAQIYFTNVNDCPELTENSVKIIQGKTLFITKDMLYAVDSDNKDNELIFTLKGLVGVHFEKVESPVQISSFAQEEINQKEIKIIYDGSGAKPAYEVSVSDGQCSTPYYSANITFRKSISSYYIWIGAFAGMSILCCVTLTGTVAAITATGIYLSKKRNKELAEIELLSQGKELELGEFLIKYVENASNLKVGKRLGSGSFGMVFQAEWAGQNVAYKIFNMLDVDMEAVQRETEIMISANHPNIVRLYRLTTAQNRIGFIMEYMDMGSLGDVIKNKKIKLDNKAKWNIAYDTASALKFLHGENIVHRDIKPDNILLYEDKNEIHAKVGDLGLSKKQTENTATIGIGTYKYMAPEMALQIAEIDSKLVDIYALGMTLVAMINEREPYPKKANVIGVPNAVAQGEIHEPILPNKCCASFFKLVNSCRNIKLANRPSAGDVCDDLQKNKNEIISFTPSNAI